MGAGWGIFPIFALVAAALGVAGFVAALCGKSARRCEQWARQDFGIRSSYLSAEHLLIAVGDIAFCSVSRPLWQRYLWL